MTTGGDNRDGRVPAVIVVTALGAALVLGVWRWSGDSLQEFLSVALYSVGWALLTFGALHFLTGRFDAMKWRRTDHDLAGQFEVVLTDEDAARTEGSESQ